MATIKSYPLQWPAGWKRTEQAERKSGQFKSGKSSIDVSQASRRIFKELEMMGINTNDLVISTNIELTLGGPLQTERVKKDPGVAIYWIGESSGKMCMAIDAYTNVAQNLAAIAATLEAMRAIERHGGAEILNRAFSGFNALPAAGETSGIPLWRDVLGFKAGTKVTREDVELNFRALSKKAHPDTGGSNGEFAILSRAREMAIAELGG